MIVKRCAFVLESQSFFIVCLFVTNKKKVIVIHCLKECIVCNITIRVHIFDNYFYLNTTTKLDQKYKIL